MTVLAQLVWMEACDNYLASSVSYGRCSEDRANVASGIHCSLPWLTFTCKVKGREARCWVVYLMTSMLRALHCDGA